MTTDQGTMEQARATASSAADETKQVAGTARDAAQHVAGDAAEQVRSVAGETVGQLRDQMNDQVAGQRDRLVTTLQSVGDDLERMAGQADDGGIAGDLARQAAGRARALREHLDGREPAQVLDDVRDFARRRPGMFLLGAVAAGVVAGRLFRATADGAAAATLAEPTAPATRDLAAADALPPVPPVPPGPALAPSSHGQPTIEAP